jgi:hypothetical protein
VDFHGVTERPSVPDGIPNVMIVGQGLYNKKYTRGTFDGKFRL